MIYPATVVSVDPIKRRLGVMLPSGQVPGSVFARVLGHGYADALRVHQSPMPVKGTEGLVALVHGKTENAVWLGSLYNQSVDAFTHPTDPDVEYTADHAGGFSLTDGQGNWTRQFADGTTVTVGATATAAQPTRNIVKPDQTRQSVPSLATDRRPTAAAAMHTIVKTGGGVTIHVLPTGSVSIDMPAGQTLNISQAGGALNYLLTRVDKLIAKFNAHVHSASGAGVPTVPLVATDIQSNVLQVSA